MDKKQILAKWRVLAERENLMGLIYLMVGKINLCIIMLRIPERQESDKRKDTTSSHQFAAKLIKNIDYPIIFSIIMRKIKNL